MSHTLFRLETALKDFYQLREMKVPDTEEELRWSLNRFLEAASKKHNPARIVIIIDGINRLKSEGALDGALHWLPTELPPCVRFFVSSVEFERIPRGKMDIPQHRTFVELNRRHCPLLKIEPLSVNTRDHVINAFVKQNEGRITLSKNEQFKMVTAPATSQPMYLRILLQGLRLCSSLTNASTDELLDEFLSCSQAHELINKTLDICTSAVFEINKNSDELTDEVQHNQNAELLGKIFSVVYAARNGLTEAEVWGVIKMVTKFSPDVVMSVKLMTILKDFTMVVNDMHTFSHEIYREVVYEKYIKKHEHLIRWHYLMARYFGQLPPCGRKLVSLPYHLEVAGSWSKVKNCLTEIEMFELWWTPTFKKDFMKFWSSLTVKNLKREDDHQVTKNTKTSKNKNTVENSRDGAESTKLDKLNKKPSYDIVEEYVKSLDDYILRKHPSDETVANIILQIADFLLEFATLGHEKEACVPQNVHPAIPPDDLCAIGVPHIIVDDEGRSSLRYPALFPELGALDDGLPSDAPSKAVEDIPICTTYFFQRWMWIQFPLIGLGNCNYRFQDGIQKLLSDPNHINHDKKKLGDESLRSTSAGYKKRGKQLITGKEMSKSWSTDSFKLPEIKFTRKVARSVRRVSEVADEAAAAADKFTQRMMALQDDIQNYREEHDFVVQMKGGLTKRLAELRGSFVELTRSAESCSQFDGELAAIVKGEADSIIKNEESKVLHKNLTNLVMMCDRHPPKMPALIAEVEAKIEQDIFLLAEIKKRLWEQRFEKNTHVTNYRKMKALVQEGVAMHNELVGYRYEMKHKLTKQAAEDQKKLTLQITNGGSTKKLPKTLRNKSSDKNGIPDPLAQVLSHQTWEEIWSVISSRTGIIEPEIFFQRINNRSALEEQIVTLKKNSEMKLEQLKQETTDTEKELGAVQLEASFAGGLSCKDKEKEFIGKQQQLRHTKERSESAQQLVQQVESGLIHVAEVLGIQGEEDTAGLDLLKEIEAVLETLCEEREKQIQAQSQSGFDSHPSRVSIVNREVIQSPETHHRTPELEVALAKYEMPKSRLPSKLPSKPLESARVTTTRDSDEENDDEEGMWDRSFAKTQSVKNLRLEQKKASRLVRGDIAAEKV